jgi:hypothetical protein
VKKPVRMMAENGTNVLLLSLFQQKIRCYYGIKAMKEVFGGEKEYFQHLAEIAKKGNFNAMKLLLEYTYGKASDSIDKDTKVVNKQAPQITFNVTQVPEKLDQAEIIDITPDE